MLKKILIATVVTVITVNATDNSKKPAPGRNPLSELQTRSYNLSKDAPTKLLEELLRKQQAILARFKASLNAH